MKQVTIAEILHHAADVCLSGDQSWYGGKRTFSCCAIDLAVLNLVPGYNAQIKMIRVIKYGLCELGLKTSSLTEFSEFTYGRKQQGARYAWLKFCALLAEEQGV